jgi:hypothetical protein
VGYSLKCKFKLSYCPRSVCQSVLVSGQHLGHATNFLSLFFLSKLFSSYPQYSIREDQIENSVSIISSSSTSVSVEAETTCYLLFTGRCVVSDGFLATILRVCHNHVILQLLICAYKYVDTFHATRGSILIISLQSFFLFCYLQIIQIDSFSRSSFLHIRVEYLHPQAATFTWNPLKVTCIKKYTNELLIVTQVMATYLRKC